MFTALSFMDQIHGRRVIVTGAGGFIGPRVLKALLDGGAIVTALTGPPGKHGRQLCAPLLENVTADITDVAAVESIINRAEIVVHMAGPPSVALSFDDPAGFARTHVSGTATVLEASRKAGVRRFVYVSSAEVYGRPQTSVVSEDHPVAPRSPYGAAK